TCQSFENPSTLEYSHIGETTMRLVSVSERIGSGSKRCGIRTFSHTSRSGTDREAERGPVQPARRGGLVRVAPQPLDRLPLHRAAGHRLAEAVVQLVVAQTDRGVDGDHGPHSYGQLGFGRRAAGTAPTAASPRTRRTRATD